MEDHTKDEFQGTAALWWARLYVQMPCAGENVSCESSSAELV